MIGAYYFNKGADIKHVSLYDETYYYELYHGKHIINIQRGDCAFIVHDIAKEAVVVRGPASVASDHFGVVIRGYSPPNRSSSLNGRMTLPYVNGCSTRQIFPPERIGDPTMQMLQIPSNSKEQEHHIHSTSRVVYVLSGSGKSVVGSKTKNMSEILTPGMSIVLDNMVPHHFETFDEPLVVIPVHIWSAAPNGLENNHPMFNGTFKV